MILIYFLQVTSQTKATQLNPSSHETPLATYTPSTPAQISQAIETALAAKPAWENLPFVDRAAIFLKAAELVTKKYRYEVIAATMLGQGKNIWQAEIDSAAESADFFRYDPVT